VTAPRAADRLKNKIEKSGVLIAPEKLGAKTPRQPGKTPRSHQQKTIILHGGKRQTPCKTAPAATNTFFFAFVPVSQAPASECYP
jgi:hypothetical protein